MVPVQDSQISDALLVFQCRRSVQGLLRPESQLTRGKRERISLVGLVTRGAPRTLATA